MIGRGGKYDEEAEALLRRTNGAVASLVIIVGTGEVSGFSVATYGNFRTMVSVSKILREVADEIDKDTKVQA